VGARGREKESREREIRRREKGRREYISFFPDPLP
jgi:hypothetical protein